MIIIKMKKKHMIKANQKGTTVIDRSGIVKDPSVMSQHSKPKRVTY
jgi:hypothetical protein